MANKDAVENSVECFEQKNLAMKMKLFWKNQNRLRRRNFIL